MGDLLSWGKQTHTETFPSQNNTICSLPQCVSFKTRYTTLCSKEAPFSHFPPLISTHVGSTVAEGTFTNYCYCCCTTQYKQQRASNARLSEHWTWSHCILVIKGLIKYSDVLACWPLLSVIQSLLPQWQISFLLKEKKTVNLCKFGYLLIGCSLLL